MVHARRQHAGDDLAGGRPGIGDLGQLQGIGAAQAGREDRAHQIRRAPSGQKRSRTTRFSTLPTGLRGSSGQNS